MTRPALIIGLGGTGQGVLTFLKKELLEIGKGKLPSQVRLLAFDTTSQVAAQTGQPGRQQEEDIRAGSVRLEKGTEFIPLGENVLQLASEIAQKRHPHLHWFPAASFLGKLAPAAFNTKEGSGQIRHMGRITVFRDVMNPVHSRILSHLRAAIQFLQREVSRDRQLEVIIVSSLAGGTGAGMLVDMALLVRAQAARLVQQNYLLRGFFVLPRAFVAGGLGEGQDMLARAFATWRELDRFMIASERFGIRQMNYHEMNTNLHIRIDKKAYDVSYLIDTAREQNPLDKTRPEEGIFPAIANVISAILDDKAGQSYTEYVTANIAGKLAQLPRRPYHSVIGSFTLKVPVYYAEARFSHQLALDALKIFLAPEVNEKGRVTGVSEIRNREVGEHELDRVRAALKFMAASSINIFGEEIPNTRFLPLVAEIREREGLHNNATVQQIARGGLTTANSRFLNALTDISQDEEGKLILRDISDELNIPLWRVVPPSADAGDTPEAAYTRIKNRVPQFRQEHYGIDTAAGERLRGKYGKALDRAKTAQVARFRKFLRAWTFHTLNGESQDPRIARGGKLGYVRAFYRGLSDNLNYFLQFLNEVRRVRNEELRLAAQTRQAADAALREYERLRSKKCWFCFWDDFTHPDAHRAQRNYLLAEQRDIDVRKDDILLDVLSETALEMQAIVESTLQEIESWIAHLVTGDASLGIVGLYATALASLDNVNANHELDKRLHQVAQIIGEHEYQTSEQNLLDVLARLKWQVEDSPQGLRLICGIEFPADEEGRPPSFRPFRREGENPEQHNLKTILELANRYYQVIHQERPLAREIVNLYSTGKQLAEGVENLAEPMYLKSSAVRGAQMVNCLIRVHSTIDENTTLYFKEFEDTLRERKPNIQTLRLVDSEDVHKMTIVRSDDLLPSEDFQMWHACQEAYIQQVNDPYRRIPAAELHIFPAEINACAYEAEMPAVLGKNYRTLHPEVVALLEDRERFELFWRAYALGFIRREEDDRGGYWVYQLPDQKEPLYLSLPPRQFNETEADLFQVIHNFVMEAVDQRPGRNQQLFVDWDDLFNAIIKAQRTLGKDQVIERYRYHKEDPEGIVQFLHQEVKRRRQTVKEEYLRPFEAREWEDLADVAAVVYEKAIRSLKGRAS